MLREAGLSIKQVVEYATNAYFVEAPEGTGQQVFEIAETLLARDAGVACANGAAGASGVAPKARLMPIRLASGLGSQREADAFKWAADHGADVISCSWGPTDGKWWNLNDPRHKQKVPLPASTRLALEYVTTQGRGGKGCVVLFAAGNGNESIGRAWPRHSTWWPGGGSLGRPR